MKQAEIDAIKGRLAAVPGLPWAIKDGQIYSPSTQYYIGTEGEATDPEIAFMLHAGSDVAALLGYVEQLRGKLGQKERLAAIQSQHISGFVQEQSELLAETEQLRQQVAQWKGEARAHAQRAASVTTAAPYCNGHCGICDCQAAPAPEPLPPPEALGQRPWCARCTATEHDVNQPEFKCGLCAAEGL